MAVSYRYDGMNRLTYEDRNGTGERYEELINMAKDLKDN